MSITVIAELTAASKEARYTLVEALSKVSAFSKRSEPGVLQHAVTVPRDSADDKAVHVFEAYADQTAFDSHMSSKAVTDLIAFFTDNSSLFGAPTVVLTMETSSAFVRPELTKSSDPIIAHASIDYKDGTREEALEGWKKVTAETQKNEPNTLSYAILRSKDTKVTVGTLEVYANENSFKEVHAKSKAVLENKAKYGDQVRTSFKLVLTRLVGGYLAKDKNTANL